MTTYQLFFLAQTSLIPITVCLVKYPVIRHLYKPLFLYLLVKEITEIVSILTIKFFKTGSEEPYNIMYVLEALLINWQFFKLGAYGKKRNLYYALQVLWIILWVTDVLLIHSIHDWNIIFRVTYCFILPFVAVSLISTLAVRVRHNIYQNTGFLLSLVFGCWFTYNIVYEFAEQMSAANTANGSWERMSNIVTSYIGIAEALMFLGCAWAVHYLSVKKK